MGHAIIFFILGLCHLFCPESTFQGLMDQEANEAYREGRI